MGKTYSAISISGTTGAMTSIDGSGLSDLDLCYTLDNGSLRLYQLDADSALPVDSPFIVAPTDNAGTKRWIYQLVEQGSPTYTNTTISSILTRLGTTNKYTLTLPRGTWSVTSNIDLSAYTNITFVVPRGAVISHGTYTIGITNIDAGRYQIFSGTGLISGLRDIDVAWFGAVNDGVTDSTTPITRAMISGAYGNGNAYETSTGARVKFGNGSYLISDNIPVYPGQYIDGESPGGVIVLQSDKTKSGFVYTDRNLGINAPITIKRIVVSYPTLGDTAATAAFKLWSAFGVSPNLEDCIAYQAYDGFSLKKTVNAQLKNLSAINCGNYGYYFPLAGGGVANNGLTAHGCYASGCTADGFNGYVSGSTLTALTSNSCAIGYNFDAENSFIAGASSACTTGGLQLNAANNVQAQMSITPAAGGYGMNLVNSTDIVLITPKIVWTSGGTYAITSSGTTARITVTNPAGIDAFPSGKYTDADLISDNSHVKGSFTPALSASGSTFNYAANGQVGRYTKIGNRVFFTLRIQLATSGNTLASNPMTIIGLPYTTRNQTNLKTTFSVYYNNVAAASLLLTVAVSDANSTSIILYNPVASSAALTVANADFLHATNGSVVAVSGQYETDE